MPQDLLIDWKFWSLLVSAIALALSQLPPVHIMLRKANLDLEVFSRMHINQKIGNPILNMHLILRNLGGKPLRIKKMYTNIYRDGTKILTLPAQTYMANSKDNQNILLTSYILKPDDEWSYMTSFLNYFDRNEEREYRSAEINLKNEIRRLRDDQPEETLIHADDSFVEPFNKIFEKKFQWFDGDYILEVVIETDNSKLNIIKRYRFTMFESLTNDFIKQKDVFTTGAGIYWDSSDYVGTWIELEKQHS